MGDDNEDEHKGYKLGDYRKVVMSLTIIENSTMELLQNSPETGDILNVATRKLDALMSL